MHACRSTLEDPTPDLGDRVLEADARRNLFLAFKEAINNAVKHARASQVTVTITCGHALLTVAVTDNGRGIDESATGRREDGSLGNGLDNMRARLAAVGGDLSLTAAAGGGTCVAFRLTLHGPSPRHTKM